MKLLDLIHFGENFLEEMSTKTVNNFQQIIQTFSYGQNCVWINLCLIHETLLEQIDFT